MSAKAKEPPKASQLVIGRCGQGVCLDMLDRQGKVICHAHGFDAIGLMGQLKKMILEDATSTSAGCA